MAQNNPTSNSGTAAYQTISGSVERITYHNEQNGYTVLRLRVPGYAESVTVTGNFSLISPGENLLLTGWWTIHPQYGDQFKAVDYQITRPATIAGIQKYLGSGLIKGIGPVTAKRIVEHFGEQTLEIIEKEIWRLLEIKGVSRKRAEKIGQAWAEQRAIKEVMLFLQGHGVSTHFAVRIFKQYGSSAITVVEQSPYRLAAEVYGIGFKTADQIARNLGIAADAEERLRAGLQYVLSQATEAGHCYLPSRELLRQAAETLGVEERPRLAAALEALLDEGQLKIEEAGSDHAIYLPPLWQAERSLARRLRKLMERPVRVELRRVNSWIDRYTEKKGIELSEEQRRAVQTAAAERVMVLTGGPGTGKTTSLKAIVALFHAMQKRVLLASPTGRAAQRLSEVVGEEAKTLHRLLEFDPSRLSFKRNEENPLEADLIIVDEASMLDLLLANNLLKAVPLQAQLILVGDVDQLPSVGPGTVLRDLIDSGRVPVVRLTQVFRQAAASLIIQNAHRINRGQFPYLIKPGQRKTDCYFIEAEEPQEIVNWVVRVVAQSLPRRFGYNPLTDIQVLAPMNRGQVGVGHLNLVLQQHLNPPHPGKAEFGHGHRVLRVGDKVIQKVNNYRLEVFNGDLGIIERIELEDRRPTTVDGRASSVITVRFSDRLVCYDYADVLELGHGFCVSIHKAQGSEYPAVVIPLHMQHFMLLSRNLLYTALTRAKEMVVMIGTTRAISAAMHNLEAVHRFTGLVRELKG